MKRILVGAIALAIFGVTSATAQSVVAPVASSVAGLSPVQPMTAIEPEAQVNVLRAGVEVPLLTREELTTKKKLLRVGQRFQLEVAANVEANGVVVIPVGTPAVGEITEVRNKGMWGKSGYIGARVVSMRVGDRNIRLTGTFDDKGVTGTGGVVAAVAFVPIAGFITTGTSAFIPTGSPVKAFLDEDVAYRAVQAQAKVLEVSQAVTAVPVAAPAAAAPVQH